MLIRFTKGRGKPNTIACVRDDGSTTWSRQVPVQHDLVHYVVETTLGLKNAFYGLVAGGYDLSDFTLPKADRPALSLEAVQTEFVVGLLEVELADGARCDDFMAELNTMCIDKGVTPPPPLSPDIIDRLRTTVRDLLLRWYALDEGERLELSFD